jgi:tetratricopeptide (TPR) repeat protein
MRLVALSGDQQFSFPLRQGSTLIGRQSDCHICIPARGLSRKHCQLYVDGDQVTVRDLGSANHMFVNGHQCERAELHDGDILTLGQFQLRFDTTPAGAYPPPPHGGEEIIDAEPEYAGAATESLYEQPAQSDYSQPHQQDYEEAGAEGVPPPTDFPEHPSGDETPVDNAFMPATYAGAQQQFGGGAAGQPQLLVRDGRWFLCDPTTGREIEIAPKDGGALPGAQATQPNRRLLLGIAAAAVIGVIAFAVLFLKPPPPPEREPAPPLGLYYKVVDAAVGQVRDGNFDEAVRKLEVAKKAKPNVETADLLIRYIRLVQENPDSYSLSEGQRVLDSLKDVPSITGEVKAFVEDGLTRIDKEFISLGQLQEARDLLQREGENEETLKTAIRMLDKIDKNTRAGRAAAKEHTLLRGKLAGMFIRRAETEAQAQRWQPAVQYLNSALDYVDTPSELRKTIAFYQQNDLDRAAVERARQQVNDTRYDAAVPTLEAIADSSPYSGEAKALLEQIKTAKARKTIEELEANALQLYKEGDGPGAVDMVKKNDLDKLGYIEDRVRRYEELMTKARKAIAEERYREAETLLDDLTNVETDAENEYRRRAERAREDFNAHRPEYAAKLADRGFEKMEDDPLGARNDFEEAIHFDPEQPKARRGLEQLHRNAGLLRNAGMQALRDGKTKEARRLLEDARDRANPGSELHGKLIREIAGLPEL